MSIISRIFRGDAGVEDRQRSAVLAKLVPCALLGLPGQLGPTNLGTALLLTPLAARGMALGLRLHHRVDPATSYRLCYVFVALTGGKLIYDGLA